MISKLLRQKVKILKKDIEIDVLIIGYNLTGALTAYTMLEQHLRPIIINKDPFQLKGIHNQIENESYDINKLNISDLNKMELFKEVLGTVYELDDLNKKLKNKINYSRNPNVSYKNEKVSNGIQLFTGIYYDFGIGINKYKLLKRLFTFLERNKVGLFSNTEVIFCRVDEEQNIIAMTNNGYKIKCKKIINTVKDTNVFITNSINEQGNILTYYNENNHVLDNLLEVKSLLNNHFINQQLKEKTV